VRLPQNPRRVPAAIDERSSTAALRAIAALEASKGVLVVLIAGGLLTLLHRDVPGTVEHVLAHLHIHADRRIGHALIDAFAHATDGRLWSIASACVLYAAARFTESYGLWNRRVWAEWFALLSGALYLPWEILQVLERRSLVHWSIFFVNLAIVLYMLYVRIAALQAAPLGTTGNPMSQTD
jgi:uncharacterized membrane protein (DUF2068 family)